MKIQDLLFLVLLGGILASRKTIILVYAGLLCLILAIPLFAKWIFFTAERLTWYAAGFFLIYCLLRMVKANRIY